MIVAFVLLALMSVMIITFIEDTHDNFEKNITVDADGVTEEVVAVRELMLLPTESKEYSINLVCAASGAYRIFLDYEEKADGGMKPFVDVVVKSDDKVVYSGNLAELIDGKRTVEFEGELFAKDPLVVTVCYEMPGGVGNEAQGTFADFDVRLKIKKI